MIEPDHPDLSIGQQCKLLSIARSSFYYTPKGETEQNLGLMRRIDEQFLETPFFGVRHRPICAPVSPPCRALCPGGSDPEPGLAYHRHGAHHWP